MVGGRWLVVAGRKTQSQPKTRIQFLACSQGALDAKLSSVRPLCDFHALHVCVCVCVCGSGDANVWPQKYLK